MPEPWTGHLDDDPSLRGQYVDRDLSRWAIDPAEIVAWLRGRTGAHGGGFTSADDVADAIEREFVDRERGGSDG